MILAIMGSVAQFERARLTERIREGVARRRATKGVIGRALWGTTWYGTRRGEKRWLQIIPEDYELGEWICAQYEAGHSAYDIAAYLMRCGVEKNKPKSQSGGRRGKRRPKFEWSVDAVRRTLTRQQRLRELIKQGVVKFPKGYIQPVQEGMSK